MAGKTTGNTGAAVIISVTSWWIVLLEGIFALVFGIFLIAEASITTVFLVTASHSICSGSAGEALPEVTDQPALD